MKSTKELYSHFCILFPTYASQVKAYFPNGDNSIRLRLDGFGMTSEFVFTYKGGTEWQFETLKHYKNEGGKKK